MIEVRNINKNFDAIKAIDDISATIEEGHVFGLIGTNGAGKSTFMRILCGVLKADSGEVLIDGESVYDNPAVKANVFYISDDQYFFKTGTPKDMLKFYMTYYNGFDGEKFKELMKAFNLDINRKVNTFSKGMKKQLSVICGVCAGTKYLLCDETFDGLDPVMRQAIKSLFAKEIADRGLTPIIASHNLRELEDICDHIGLLHKGGVLLSKDLDDLKCNLIKVQCVLPPEHDEYLMKTLEVLKMQRRGKLLNLTIRGKESEILKMIEALDPIYIEALPLSLEEIFISETEVVGYDMQSIIL